MTKPSIIDVVSQRVDLRRAGRELVGICPFHPDKNPSLYVNDVKGVFLCRSCGVGGDSIRFVELAEQTDFKGALKILGINGGDYRPMTVDTRKRNAAAMLAAWMNQQHLKIGAMLRELSRNIAIAKEDKAKNLIERLEREFSILEVVFDDLQRPEFAKGFLNAKDAIERITEAAPLEPLPVFPLLTPEYRRYLAEVVRC